MELAAKFDFCNWLNASESNLQFTISVDNLEASRAENNNSNSDISVSSVHTCDLTYFD